MFVNPFGGKKKGLEIWQKRVQPLMNVAGVDTKVVVTERAGHIRDYLHGYSTSHDLDTYQVTILFFITRFIRRFASRCFAKFTLFQLAMLNFSCNWEKNDVT